MAKYLWLLYNWISALTMASIFEQWKNGRMIQIVSHQSHGKSNKPIAYSSPSRGWLYGSGCNMHCRKQDGPVCARKASISGLSDGLLPSPWHMLSHLSIQENFQTIVKYWSWLAPNVSWDIRGFGHASSSVCMIFLTPWVWKAWVGLSKRRAVSTHISNVLCTQTLLHTDAFTHRHFYTQPLLHTDTFTQKLFYTQAPFTQKLLYTQTLLHTDALIHGHFYTLPLLRTDAFTQKLFYTPNSILHKNSFTHRRFYTQTPLHTETFTRSHFYTQALLHSCLRTDACTHRRSYTQTLWHTDAFTHRRFYTKTLLHWQRGFYTQTLLHTNAFTERRFYTCACTHRRFCTHRCLYTQALLHTGNFTHIRFYTDAFAHRRF